jgi:hypothetical protein
LILQKKKAAHKWTAFNYHICRLPYFVRVAAAQARFMLFIMRIEVGTIETGQFMDQSFISLSS